MGMFDFISLDALERMGFYGFVAVLVYAAWKRAKEGIEHWWARILGGIGFHFRKFVARSVAANLTAWD